MRRRPFDRRDLALVILPAAAMTVTALATKSFWGDEILSLQVAARPWREFAAALSEDYHPPLYFALLKIWVTAFGDGEVGLRVFQGVQSAAFLATSLQLFRTLFPRRPPGLAFALLLVSVELWLFGPMLRYYMLAAALAAGATVALLRWMERPQPGGALALGFLYTLLLYTDYPASFVIALHAGFVLWTRRDLLGRYVAALALVALSFLPWVWVLARQVGGLLRSDQVADFNTTLAAIPLKVGFGLYAFTIGETIYPVEPAGAVGMVLLAGLAVFSVLRGKWRALEPREVLCLAAVVLGLLATAILTTLVSRHTSFVYTPARALSLLVFVYLVVGVWLERFGPSRARWVLAGTLAGLALYGQYNLAANRHLFMPVYAVPWRTIVAELDGERGVVVADEGDCYAYYARRAGSVEPRQVEPATLAALRSALDGARAHGGGAADRVTAFLVLTERESTAPTIAPEVIDALQRHGRTLDHRVYVPYDPTYRWIKQRLLRRPPGEGKVHVYRYEVSAF